MTNSLLFPSSITFQKLRKFQGTAGLKEENERRRKHRFFLHLCKDKKRKSSHPCTAGCSRLVERSPSEHPGWDCWGYVLPSSPPAAAVPGAACGCHQLSVGKQSSELADRRKQLLITLQSALTWRANSQRGPVGCSAFISPAPSNISVVLFQCESNQAAWHHWWLAGGQELQRGSLKSSSLHLGSSTGCPSSIEVTEPAWLALCSWVASSGSRGLDAGGPAQHPTGEGPQPGWEHTCTLPRYLPLQSCLLQPFSPRNAAIWDCHCDNLFIMQIGPLPACPSVSFGCLLYLCTGDCCEEILHTQQFNNPLEYGVDSACAALQICLWIN